MDLITTRYRKPKKRPTKRSRAGKENHGKRFKNETSCEPTSSSSENLEVVSNTSFGEEYTLMSNKMWSSFLSDIPCTFCGQKKLTVDVNYSYGFSSKLTLTCENCSETCGSTFSSERECLGKKFDINNKMVQAFLSIGKGHAALEILSMILGIPAMDKKTFSDCMDTLSKSSKDTKENVLKVAWDIIKERYNAEKPENVRKDCIDLCVSFDGTWHKRGHTSLYGIGVVIDMLTGLVVDYEILSKYCHECVVTQRDLGPETPEFEAWYSGHKDVCQKNFSGSSNSMEMYTAEIMWKRSQQQSKFRYISMLSDGDSKTFNHLKSLNVYGQKCTIVKQECINHVAKRLGKALSDKVKEWKIKGVTLGGKKRGNLTEDNIRRLQNYYRKAIKDNAPNVDAMKTAILASLQHCMSTDKAPKHSKCPTGSMSWCFYQRALAEQKNPPKHSHMKTHICESVVEKILPVYQRLMTTELLERCTFGATQNANESVNSCIWQKCPKEVFISKKRLDLAVLSAVCQFNFGCKGGLQLVTKKENDISVMIADKRDSRRYRQKETRATDAYKQKRNLKKFCKATLVARNLKKEGTTYAAGGF